MTNEPRGRGVLPGFGLSLGFTLFYLGLVILIPLSTVFLKTASLSPAQIWAKVSAPRTLAAFRLSFGASFVAAAINTVFGLLLAWVLERYRFPGKRLVDGLVDLPFALPTAVAGIALATVYSGKGWIGRYLEPAGIHVAYTPIGVVVALTFVGLPFPFAPALWDFVVSVSSVGPHLNSGEVTLPGGGPAMEPNHFGTSFAAPRMSALEAMYLLKTGLTNCGASQNPPLGYVAYYSGPVTVSPTSPWENTDKSAWNSKCATFLSNLP